MQVVASEVLAFGLLGLLLTSPTLAEEAKVPSTFVEREFAPVDYPLKDGRGNVASTLKGIRVTLAQYETPTARFWIYMADYAITNRTWSEVDDAIFVFFNDKQGRRIGDIYAPIILSPAGRGDCNSKDLHFQGLIFERNKWDPPKDLFQRASSITVDRPVNFTRQHECK